MTRHLTNKEFELLIEAKSEGVSPELRQHLEQCGQCRQEFNELSAVFHWPVVPGRSGEGSFADQVMQEVSRREKRATMNRLSLILGSLSAALLLIVSLPYLWQFLPESVQGTLLGYLPSIEWRGLMETVRSMGDWQPSSPFYLLLGGVASLVVVMLADSIVLSKLFRKLRDRAAHAPLAKEQSAQGNRT